MNIRPVSSLPSIMSAPSEHPNPGIVPDWMQGVNGGHSFPWWSWWYGYIPGTWHPETKTFVPSNPADKALMELEEAPEGFFDNPQAFLA